MMGIATATATLGYIALATLLSVAVWVDSRRQRIPNTLAVAGGVVAICLHALLPQEPGLFGGGGGGVLFALQGAAVGLAALLPLYFLHAMGAGDVKLMAAVGAFLGPWQTVGAVLLTLGAGGVLAFAFALRSGALGRLFDNLRLMLFAAMTGKSGPSVSGVASVGRMPYALAIAAGTALQLWLAASGGWVFA